MKQVHCDFTSFTVDGYYDETDEKEGIKITYGFNKDHRPDKKQFMQEVAVTNDGEVPLATQSLDVNTADVTRYIPVWKELKECMGSSQPEKEKLSTLNRRIENAEEGLEKKIGRGKPCPESKYQEIEKTIYDMTYSINIKAKEEAEKLCGYFILATNKSSKELSMKEALTAYKQEWKVERVWANLKGPLQVVPIYLRLPQHVDYHVR